MELYQARSESIARAKSIFSNIYAQLSKEPKGFRASLVGPSLRSRDLNCPLEWLGTASLIYCSRRVKEQGSIPLKEGDGNNCRIHLLDLGSLAYQSDIDLTSFVTSDAKNTPPGAFFESCVPIELKAYGFPLLHWKGKGGSEFEFLLEIEGKIISIDVKKRGGSLKSLAKCKEANACQIVVKVSMNRLGYDQETKILVIPLYMVFAGLKPKRILPRSDLPSQLPLLDRPKPRGVAYGRHRFSRGAWGHFLRPFLSRNSRARGQARAWIG